MISPAKAQHLATVCATEAVKAANAAKAFHTSQPGKFDNHVYAICCKVFRDQMSDLNIVTETKADREKRIAVKKVPLP